MPTHKTWKLILKKGNEYYKVLIFWGWKKDATLNMEICSENKGLHTINNVKEIRRINPNGISSASYSISYADITATDFIPHKYSFHPSGVVHVTNKKGEKHVRGNKAVPFEKVENFQLLALLAPHEPSTYPVILKEQIKDQLDVVINMDILNNSPFQIEIYLVRGDRKPIPKPIVESNATTIDINCGNTETYILLVRCKQTSELLKQAFPPYTLIGTVLASLAA